MLPRHAKNAFDLLSPTLTSRSVSSQVLGSSPTGKKYAPEAAMAGYKMANISGMFATIPRLLAKLDCDLLTYFVSLSHLTSSYCWLYCLFVAAIFACPGGSIQSQHGGCCDCRQLGTSILLAVTSCAQWKWTPNSTNALILATLISIMNTIA